MLVLAVAAGIWAYMNFGVEEEVEPTPAPEFDITAEDDSTAVADDGDTTTVEMSLEGLSSTSNEEE